MGNSPTPGRRFPPGRTRLTSTELPSNSGRKAEANSENHLHHAMTSTAHSEVSREQMVTEHSPAPGDPRAQLTTRLMQQHNHEVVVDRLTSRILDDLVDSVTGDVVTILRSKAKSEPPPGEFSEAEAGKGRGREEDDSSPTLTSPESNSSSSSSSDDDEEDWKADMKKASAVSRRGKIPALVLSDEEEVVVLPDDTERQQQPSAEVWPSPSASPVAAPACLFAEENLRGLVADLPGRTAVLVRQAVRHLWEARSSAALGCREPALVKASEDAPAQFSADYCDAEDLDPQVHSLPGIHFVSRTLIFDVIAEFVGKIYAGEDAETAELAAFDSTCCDLATRSRGESAEPPTGQRRRLTSAQFRLWQGPTRPMTEDRLLDLVRGHVLKELRLNQTDSTAQAVVVASTAASDTGHPGGVSGVGAFPTLSRLAQWTLSRKAYVDQILELELRADEGSWLSYVPEEERLKRLLADQLWQELLDGAVSAVLSSARVKAALPEVGKVR